VDGVLLAKGNGVNAPAAWEAQSLGLVLGSDLAMQLTAEGQFDELVTFRPWPKLDEEAFYFRGVSRQVALGPQGTPAEEAAKLKNLSGPTSGMSLTETLPLPPGAGGGDTNGPAGDPQVAYDYPSNTLWIEIRGVTNELADLTLHGTVAGEWYQLLSKTNLTEPGEWTLGELITGAAGTNQTDFTPANVGAETNMFFRAHHGAGYV